MRDQVNGLLGQKDYVPLNVPELLRRLRLPPHRQQELQAALKKLEQAGEVAHIEGLFSNPDFSATTRRK